MVPGIDNNRGSLVEQAGSGSRTRQEDANGTSTPAGPQLAGPSVSRARAVARRTAAIAIRLALDLLVLDVVVETWQSGSPLRLGVAGAAALYLLLNVYVLSKGGRPGGRGWLMDPAAPAVLLLGFLVACSWARDTLVHGVVMLRLPTPVLLPAALGLLAVIGMGRMAGPGGVRPPWLKALLAVVGLYVAFSFAQAIQLRLPLLDMLSGRGFPAAAPWWLQGTWIGAFLLVPLALLREIGTAIARLVAFPYLRWIVVFGMGCWVLFNAAGLR